MGEIITYFGGNIHIAYKIARAAEGVVDIDSGLFPKVHNVRLYLVVIALSPT